MNKISKAIQQIPKELNKLNKIIAVIGDALIDAKAQRLRQSKEEFLEAFSGRNNRKTVVPKTKTPKNTKNQGVVPKKVRKNELHTHKKRERKKLQILGEK